MGVQRQKERPSKRPTFSCSSTASHLKTRNCWSFATWTDSRSTPISTTRRTRCTRLIWTGWRITCTCCHVFTDPDSLKPGVTRYVITEQAAERFGQIADGMPVRGVPAQDAAHFLMKLMFCMFAEDIDLLPQKVFSRLLAGAKKDPTTLGKMLSSLFAAMSKGGIFGTDAIPHFNGGLFADADIVQLNAKEIQRLLKLRRWTGER